MNKLHVRRQAPALSPQSHMEGSASSSLGERKDESQMYRCAPVKEAIATVRERERERDRQTDRNHSAVQVKLEAVH